MNTSQAKEIHRYTSVARWLHAIVALLVLGIVVPAGIWIHYFEPANENFKMQLYNVHESLGVIIFGLTLTRLIWRWMNPPPSWPENTPIWIQIASRISHVSLYILLIVLPISGFFATNAWGFPLKLFEYLPIPSPIAKDEMLAKTLSSIHWLGAICMGVAFCAHFLGAIYHLYIARDDLARRML